MSDFNVGDGWNDLVKSWIEDSIMWKEENRATFRTKLARLSYYCDTNEGKGFSKLNREWFGKVDEIMDESSDQYRLKDLRDSLYRHIKHHVEHHKQLKGDGANGTAAVVYEIRNNSIHLVSVKEKSKMKVDVKKALVSAYPSRKNFDSVVKKDCIEALKSLVMKAKHSCL